MPARLVLVLGLMRLRTSRTQLDRAFPRLSRQSQSLYPKKQSMLSPDDAHIRLLSAALDPRPLLAGEAPEIVALAIARIDSDVQDGQLGCGVVHREAEGIISLRLLEATLQETWDAHKKTYTSSWVVCKGAEEEWLSEQISLCALRSFLRQR